MARILIIGGGLVGLGTARALRAKHPHAAITLVDKEPQFGAHQSTHNSGVLHSGLYYKPGSLKARNCVEGREALYRFCAEHGVAHDRCGKIVVATQTSELEPLAELQRRGNANGLKGLRSLTAEELQEFEPHVAGIAGLHVPETGIADYVQLTETYGKLAREHGATVRTDACVRAVERRSDGLTLITPQGEFQCKTLICCAGLQADRVARMCGVDPGVQIVPFRGEYYQLTPDRESLVRNLIYPVPDPRFPFLGVHFTRMIRGGIEAGPNAVFALKRYGYTRSSFSLADAWEMARFPGVWRMAAKYWKTGLGELYRSWSKRAFVAALRRLIPELRMEDVQPAGAGPTALIRIKNGALARQTKSPAVCKTSGGRNAGRSAQCRSIWL